MTQASRFANRIVMIGCGSVGQGVLPLLFDAFAIAPSQITIITADEKGRHVARHFGARYLVDPLTPDNYRTILRRHLQAGDLLLNLSVNVSSLALIAWCKAQDVLYLDTCVEPWAGGYAAKDSVSSLETSNAWLRQQALALHSPGAATAVIAHGMNPGLISHLLKQALLALARVKGVASTQGWGELAQALGVKAVHIAERDTQDDDQPLPHGVFANTWSAEGLYSEACLQKAELGWGSHEPCLPKGASVNLYGGAQTVCMSGHGANIWLKSWVPSLGEQQGMLVTHHEVVSMAEVLATDTCRPTVCYVYNPSPKARESLAKWRTGHAIDEFRVQMDVRGFDEIGALLVHDTGALWHGSTLSADEARQLAPFNNATTMQVAAGIIGAMAWMLDHPRAGVVEAENMDSEQVYAIARPWLGKVSTVETDWHAGRHFTFDEFLLTGEHDGSHKHMGAGNIRAGELKEART